MWHLTKRTVERWLESLLHIHDTPRRTAAAFGVGVAIGFSPFVGLHTVIGLIIAFVFNLNRVAVLAGCWVNLPWFMGPYYAGMTAVGAWMTHTPMPPQLVSRLHDILELPGWRNRIAGLGRLLRPLLLPYTLGSLLGAIPLGFVAYRGTFAFLLARRRHHDHHVPPAIDSPRR
jgi:uncharacterized protein (DUF2062 family)